MNRDLPLSQMTTAEKLAAMEALWADLSANAADFDAPAWHPDVLREREQRVEEGKDAYLDWEATKQQLRERLK